MPDKKLTESQENEIAQLYKDGTRSTEIAAAYKVNIATVYRVLKDAKVPLNNPNLGSRKNGPMPEQKVSDALTVKVDAKDTVVAVERVASPGNQRFAVEFRVKHVVEASSMEAAITKVKGYHGFEEVLLVRKLGS